MWIPLVVFCSSHLYLSRFTHVPPRTRYFILHILVNVYVCWETFDFVVDTLLSTPLAQEDVKRAIYCALGLHLYHCLFYSLSRADYIHHVVFIPTIGIPAIFYEWHNFGNVLLFFICGIPGAIIYSCIVYKHLVDPSFRHEPLISAVVNAFVRLPGIIMAVAQLWRHRNTVDAPLLAIGTQLLLGPANAFYYTYESITRAYSKITPAWPFPAGNTERTAPDVQ